MYSAEASQRHRSLPLNVVNVAPNVSTSSRSSINDASSGIIISDNGIDNGRNLHPATVANPIGIAGRPNHIRHGLDLSDIFQRHTVDGGDGEGDNGGSHASALADITNNINDRNGNSNINSNRNDAASSPDKHLETNAYNNAATVSQYVDATVNRIQNMVTHNATTRHLATMFHDAADKVKVKETTLTEFLNSQRASKKNTNMNPFGNQVFEDRAHNAFEFDENQQSRDKASVKCEESTSAPVRAHFRSFPRTSPSLLYRNQQHQQHQNYTQTVLTDVLSPSVIGPTNIRVVTTEERERRDMEMREALKTISLSMEPPPHNMDVGRLWVLETLKENTGDTSFIYVIIDFLLGTPFEIVRAIWHYIILEIHLAYNLGLLYVTFYTTPPLIFFVIGLTLFWIKVIYEIYRDIMHRDDPNYSSNVPKEMSIAAAISASMGFVLNIKAQGGDVTEAWWRGEE
jgi:hypothetical protein